MALVSNPRRSGSIAPVQALIVALGALALLFALFPIVWMVLAAIRPIGEILADPPLLIPHQVTLEYFQRILGSSDDRHYIANTCVVAFATVTITVGLGLIGGYGFSRFSLPGGRALLMAILALWLLPPVNVIIPYFILAHTFRVYDSVIGLIFGDTAFTLPIAIWLLKGYIDAIPVDLEEAALIDGATRPGALLRILVPLIMPGVIATATFTFLVAWNEFLIAAVLTDTAASKTLSIGLAQFFGQYVRDWNSIMALSTVSTLPVMLLFVFLQRWVVQGLTSGAGK
ncbi:MAG: carbohydrate ABC transporter permease [Chloroflexota bacterium]